MTTKEMYKNMLCRFINGMIVDTEYSIKEMSDIDYEGLCNIVRAYDKANSVLPSLGTNSTETIPIIPTWMNENDWNKHIKDWWNTPMCNVENGLKCSNATTSNGISSDTEKKEA